MNKLIFNGNIKEGISIASLIKEINSISCRMQLDMINGFLTVENVDDEQIDMVIDLIDNYYNIYNVSIDNVRTPTSIEETISVSAEEGTTEVVPAVNKSSTPTVLEPQSEDDLIIKKIEYKNEYIEEYINKFLKTASWAIYKQGISEKEIGHYIISLICEISMAYTPSPDKTFAELVVGDIVEVNYGMHLKGEIRGAHIFAIVCDITSYNMVYLVPITKYTDNLTSTNSPLPITSIDMTFYFDDYKISSGTALVDKSKYLRIERVNKVIGRVSPCFLVKLLNQLSKAFDFTVRFPTDESKNDTNTIVQTTDTLVSNDKDSKTSVIGKEESALLELFSDAFSKLSSNKSAEEQIDVFFTDIEMPTNLLLMREAFIISCTIDTITFDNVVLELEKLHPNIKELTIKSSLKIDFKNWLKKYPSLIEVSSRFSLTSLIKAFLKRIK